jgi:phage shock protein C
MTCSQCKQEISPDSHYCSFCGTSQRPSISSRRLTLSREDSKIAGVCGGLAKYLNMDPTVVRLIWAVLSVVPGGFVGGVVAYVFAWIIIPKESEPTPSAAQTAHT